MIKNLNEIEQSLGIEAGKLTEMISSEDELTVDLSSKVIFNKDDYETRINNIKKETSNAAVEIAIKNARKDLGLDFQGKTMENLLNTYKEKIEAESKIEPEERYSKLKTEFEKLQDVSKGFQEKYTGLEQTVKKQSQDREINTKLLKSIPENITIPKDDVLAILKTRNEFNIGEDGFEIIKDGVVLRNETTRNPLSVDEYMQSFIKPYLKPVEGGKGDDGGKGQAKAGSFEAFEKEMSDKGFNSQEMSLEMQKRIKDGTLKI